MKKGQKTRKTIEREAAAEAFRQLTLRNVEPLFHSQFSIARGVSYIYRIDRHKRKCVASAGKLSKVTHR
jgi:hypothetical protein